MKLLLAVVSLVGVACTGEVAGEGEGEGEGEGVVGEGEGEGAVGEGEGEGEGFAPGTLGTIADAGTACPHGTGPLAGTVCHYMTVSCPGEANKNVELFVTAPANNVTKKGLITFHSGSAGAGAYSNSDDVSTVETVEAAAMMQALVDDGFTVLERRWTGGWMEGSGGLASVACRSATMMHYIHETFLADAQDDAEGGAFCAIGNSGGSAELGMTITRYDVADDFDRVFLTSGPFADLALSCHGDADVDWVSTCNDIIDARAPHCSGVADCQMKSGIQGEVDSSFGDDVGMCTNGVDLDLLRANGTVTPLSRLVMPMPVDFVFGKEDCTAVVVGGLELERTLREAGTTTSVQFVDDAPHSIHGDVEGTAALLPLIRQNCVPR